MFHVVCECSVIVLLLPGGRSMTKRGGGSGGRVLTGAFYPVTNRLPKSAALSWARGVFWS